MRYTKKNDQEKVDLSCRDIPEGEKKFGACFERRVGGKALT